MCIYTIEVLNPDIWYSKERQTPSRKCEKIDLKLFDKLVY